MRRIVEPEQWESRFYDEKGKIYVPIEVRDLMGWRPGDTLRFIVEDGECKLVKVADGAARKKRQDYIKELSAAAIGCGYRNFGIYIGNKLVTSNQINASISFPYEVPPRWCVEGMMHVSKSYVCVPIERSNKVIGYFMTDHVAPGLDVLSGKLEYIIDAYMNTAS